MDHEQDQNDEQFSNPMIEHYKDPKQNAFIEDGLTIETIKEKNPRVWLSYPQGLKKNAIHNIMKQFGRVVSIFVPCDLGKKSSRVFAFVEYSTFKEAEKAIREINSSKKDGLDIVADFAHTKAQPKLCQAENVPQLAPRVENKEIAEEEVPKASIFINLDSFKFDDSTEKVSQFEYKGPITADLNDREQKYLKKCAEKSLGDYDEQEDCLEYNMMLKESNFLTFYCCVCDLEATLLCEESRRYFCSKECSDVFMNKQPDDQIERYHIQQLDKVCLTAIINEKSVYVRSYNEDLNFILETVFRKAKNCEPLKEMPVVNDQVIVSLFDSFYRAIILNIDDKEECNISVLVRLTDIGNTACVNINDVYEMNEECMKIKKITTNVILKNINVEAINMDVIEYLTKLLYNNTELIIKDIDENGVELKDNSTNYSVNEQIVKSSNFEHISFEIVESMNTVADLIPVGANQKLYVVNAGILKTIGGICCVSEKYVKDFHEFYRSINAYGKKIDPKSYGIYGNKPLCLAKYNNQWHRAIVNNAKGDGKPECVLIDLQFVCKIKVENIFKIPEVLAKFPFLTDIYKIDGYDTEQTKFCDENVIENDFIYVNKVEVKDDIPIIHFN
ncbi:protein vreteno-like [Chironomus tepperi]|uniref:protein vreteno-like n=1 Tax=Chironomus tepperi TaxID=113505 RepID=UPI00391F6C9A